MGMNHRGIPAVISAFMLVLSGCSSTGSVDGPVFTSPSPPLFGPGGGMDAEVTGVLVVDESTSCILMEVEDVRYPLVWPAGTRWQEDTQAVVLADGQTVEAGMTVHGAGGYLSPDRVEEFAGPEVAAAADRCAGPTREIAFFNIGSQVDVTAG